MDFFVHLATSREESEHVFNAVCDFIDSQGIGLVNRDRRIRAIEFSHNGNHYSLTVGDIFSYIGEHVLVILEAPSFFLICTKNYGVARGEPFLVTKNFPTSVHEFDVDSKRKAAP